ncbi:MAG: hypothetical protein U5Q44_13395 [Dehalococcoidia bacterium]|nr:hypothetical protein [Dehalococcoidia bacterium]
MPGARDATTPVARAVLAEEFRTGDGPEKLYQLDSSHNEPADADPATDGTTGYCIDVQNANIAPVGGASGFTAVDGTVESTDAFTGGTTPTQDDLYCAVVSPDALPADELNGTMLLQWTYTDNPAEGTPTDTIELEIDVFRVELESIDGFVGGAAEICTNNWDPDILTGVASNLAGDFLDPTDEVQLGDDPNGGDATGTAHLDWHVTQGTPTVNLDKLGMFKDGNEWCMTLSANANTAGVTVELNFDAVYRRNTNVDDQPHAVETTLDFTTPDFSEVRHVSPGGQIISSPVSPLNATGSRHTACIIPSKSTDTMAPSGVFIQPEDTASSIRTFHNDQSTMLPGVPNGTLCFSWTSHTVGEQTIQATFNYDDPDNGTEQRTAFWDTDGDGNGEPSLASAPLVKRWGAFERTEITRGGNPNANLVTDDAFDVGIAFNVADDTYSAGTISVTEWVIGRDGEDPPPDPRDVEDPGALPVPPLLDGVPLVAEITSQCGYFEADIVNEDQDDFMAQPQRLTGVSVGGRFDLDANPFESGLGTTSVTVGSETFEVINDPDGLPDDIAMSINFDDDCTPRKTIELTITAYNPWEGIDEGDPIDTETLSIGFLTSSPESTPRLAWVGQQINTTFAFGGGCAPYDPDDGASETAIDGVQSFTVSMIRPRQLHPFLLTRSSTGQRVFRATFTERHRIATGRDACSFTVGLRIRGPRRSRHHRVLRQLDDYLMPRPHRHHQGRLPRLLHGPREHPALGVRGSPGLRARRRHRPGPRLVPRLQPLRSRSAHLRERQHRPRRPLGAPRRLEPPARQVGLPRQLAEHAEHAEHPGHLLHGERGRQQRLPR